MSLPLPRLPSPVPKLSRLASPLLAALLPGAPALAATLAYDIRADCTEFCSPAWQSVLLHLELDDSGAAPGQAMAPGLLTLFRVTFGSGQVALGNSAEVSGVWAGPATPMIFVMDGDVTGTDDPTGMRVLSLSLSGPSVSSLDGVLTMFSDAACAGPGDCEAPLTNDDTVSTVYTLTSVTLGGGVTPGPGPVAPVPLPAAGWLGLGLAGLGTLVAAGARRCAG